MRGPPRSRPPNAGRAAWGLLPCSPLGVPRYYCRSGKGERVVVEFKAVQPIGARTCCDLPRKAGGFAHVWLDSEVPQYEAEFAALEAGELDVELKRRHHLDALAQVRSLRNRAAKGQLRVGRNETFPARVIQIVPYLLELRPAATAHRVFRLYYAEPETVDGALLPLVLSTKQGSSETFEQNRSIQEAKVRSRTWALYHSVGRTK